MQRGVLLVQIVSPVTPPNLYQLNQSRCANFHPRRSSFKVWFTTRTSQVCSKSRRWIRSKYRGVPSFTLFGMYKQQYTSWFCADISQNFLRIGSWYNYSHYKDQGAGPFANTEDIVKVHYSKSTLYRTSHLHKQDSKSY
jgi:hypothetical protein